MPSPMLPLSPTQQKQEPWASRGHARREPGRSLLVGVEGAARTDGSGSQVALEASREGSPATACREPAGKGSFHVHAAPGTDEPPGAAWLGEGLSAKQQDKRLLLAPSSPTGWGGVSSGSAGLGSVPSQPGCWTEVAARLQRSGTSLRQHVQQPLRLQLRVTPPPPTDAKMQTMKTLKAAALIWGLLAMAGAQDDISADQAADVVWTYFTQLSSSAKETVDQLQQSEMSRQLNTLFQENLQAVNSYAAELQKQLVPFATELYARLAEDSERLKTQINQELEQLRAQFSPYADDVRQQISRNIQELQASLSPYAEEMRTQVNQNVAEMRKKVEPLAQELQAKLQENVGSLRATLTPYADKLQQQIDRQVEDMKGKLTPYADGFQAKVDQGVVELRKSLSPYARDVQEQLNHQLEMLSFQMKKGTEELRAKVTEATEQLQRELSPYAQELREKLQEGQLQQSLAPYVEGLSGKMDQQIEEFRQTVGPYGENLNRLLVQKVEEMRQKLEPYAGEAEDHLSFLEKDVRDRFASFFDTLKRIGN